MIGPRSMVRTLARLDSKIVDCLDTGDVFVLKALGRSIVVLNSERAAVDLLERKGPKYSDRPYLPTIEL